MKIIEKGKDPKPKQCKCHRCKTKFEYDPSDVKSDRDGNYVICPNEKCGSFINVQKAGL